MNTKNKPLIIYLIKLPNGYQLQTPLTQPTPSPIPKIAKTQISKNANPRPSTRLARELSIGPEPPVVQQEESLHNVPQPQIIRESLAEEENELLLEREGALPQKPAKWFNLEEIHEIEKASLSQFFDGKSYKTPQLYVKFRNFIVKLYDKNPKIYLTKVACRRILRGDANAILRIHSFLEEQGVINFGVTLEGVRTFTSTFLNKALEMQHLPHTTTTQFPPELHPQQSTNLQTDNLTFSIVNKPFSRTFRVYCSSCKLICGVIWYQTPSSQAPLCFQCYQILPPSLKSTYQKFDIVERINSNKETAKRSNWTIQQNIKLLEIMSEAPQSWDSVISQLQGKKSLQDIILQFMQFPISNFSPQKTKSSHPKISYPHEQYVGILKNLYKDSDYSKGTVEEIFKQHTPRKEPTNTSMMIDLLIGKYSRRIEHLKELQDTIMSGNQFIRHKILRKFIRQRKTTDIKQQPKKQESALSEPLQNGVNFDDESIFHNQEQRHSEGILRLRDNDDEDYCGGLLNLDSDSHNQL